MFRGYGLLHLELSSSSGYDLFLFKGPSKPRCLDCTAPLGLALKHPVASKSSTSHVQARTCWTATGGSDLWSKGATSFLSHRAAERHVAPIEREVRKLVEDHVLRETEAAAVYMRRFPEGTFTGA
jgi:hypothetical protein